MRILVTKFLTILFLFSVVTQPLGARTAELKEWENPKLTGLNNEPPHASMVACPDVKTAQNIQFVGNRERVKSPFYQSLNGDWKYHYSANLSQRLTGFWTKDFNDREWPSIPVPSNVEISGYGIPIYVNIRYPW